MISVVLHWFGGSESKGNLSPAHGPKGERFVVHSNGLLYYIKRGKFWVSGSGKLHIEALEGDVK